MDELFGADAAQSKAEVSTTVVNKALAELVDKAIAGDTIRDRFDVAVLGYGGAGVRSAFGGEMRGVHFATASELSAKPLRIEERTSETLTYAGDIVQHNVKFRIWLDPVADGTTPMRAALNAAYDLASSWVQQHQDSFPPVVLNVTDGMPTDAGTDFRGLQAAAQQLRSVETRDGRLLLWNCHITANGRPRIFWPSSVDTIPPGMPECSLFEISSEIPPELRALFLQVTNQPLETGARGYLLNADQVGLSRFITFGTRTGDLALPAPTDDPASPRERYSSR